MKMNELILGDIWEKKWCYNNNNNINNSIISDSQKLNSQKLDSVKLDSVKLDSVKFGRRSSLGYVEEDKEGAVRRSRRKQERMVKMYVNEMMRLTEKKEGEGKRESEKEEGEEAAGAFRRGRCVWKEKCAAGRYDE